MKKDPYLLMSSAIELGIDPSILGRSRQVNEYMPLHVYQKFLSFCQLVAKNPAETHVFVVGFAFKGWPETSDMRDSSTLELIKHLSAAGVNIRGYDPVIEMQALANIAGVRPCSIVDGFQDADCIFVMNNHPSYEDWNLHTLLSTMAKPGLFFDGWHMFRSDDITHIEGISYSSLGVDNRWAIPLKTPEG